MWSHDVIFLSILIQLIKVNQMKSLGELVTQYDFTFDFQLTLSGNTTGAPIVFISIERN